MDLKKLATLKPILDPLRFLSLMKNIATRVETKGDYSISVGECKSWGFTPEEAGSYLIVLVETGFLNQRVKVFSDDEDMYLDINQKEDLDGIDPSQVQFWFKPTLSKEQLSPFFLQALL